MKLNLRKVRYGSLFALLSFSSISFSQTTYTFTSGAATGNIGPTQVEMDAEYTGTNLDGNVTVTGGIQYWTVPTTGTYSIECFGGQGYGAFGGRGAHIYGEFNFNAGDQLKILVGQMAGPYLNFPATTYDKQFGGGGGSFVTLLDNTPLVIAGGGGGNHGAAYFPANDGQIVEAGASGINGLSVGIGGNGGNGGNTAASADGGGGLLANGGGIAGGIAFVNGGAGGIDEGTGGFGCGGGTSSWNNYRGGGGGGYSGGGASSNGGTCCPAAGGGGSYNDGTNPSAIAGVQIGDGQILITNLCAPGVGSLVPDVATLSDVSDACFVYSLVDPSASNSCNGGIIGTSNAVLPISTLGTTVVTWTYDDGVNITTQDQNVIITGNDITAPVADSVSLPDVYTNSCGLTLDAPTATDFCEGAITGTPDVTFPITFEGTTVVTWSFDDGNGNISTQLQNVTLDDLVAPIADAATLSDVSGCFAVTPSIPTATDSCTGTVYGYPSVQLPITAPGLTVLTWTFDDGHGNSIYQTQNVTVETFDLGTTVAAGTISANASGMTYQWIDCTTNSAIAGETNQTFTPTSVGNFAVLVSNGTCSDTSTCKFMNFAGIDDLNSNLINIYPNPTNTGVFKVEFDGNIDQIIVIDALGRGISLPVDLSTGEVNGSALAQGKYIVKIVTSEMVYTKQIVVMD